MHRTAVITVVALVAVAFAAGAAQAAEPTPDDLIARGLELRRQAKPEKALELFRQAHAVAPSPRTLGQMGLVEASLEHWLDADAHLSASLATPGDAWVKKNRAFLEQALKVSDGHVGALVITGPDGTAVAVNGEPVGTLPALPPVKLAEGSTRVTASGAGFKDFAKTVTIVGGAKVSLAIVLDPVEKRPAVALSAPAPLPVPAAPAITVAPQGRAAWRTRTGAGLAAAGAGLLAWGVVWIAIDGNDHCATGGPACTKVYDTRTPGWILAAGGAAAAAAGAIVLLTGRRQESSGGDPNLFVAATPTSLLLRALF
jgi:hypothetical protein